MITVPMYFGLKLAGLIIAALVMAAIYSQWDDWWPDGMA